MIDFIDIIAKLASGNKMTDRVLNLVNDACLQYS